jgi:hypothetical protein
VAISVVMKIGGHLTNYDGLFIVMLIFGIVGRLFLGSVFVTFSFMNT